VLTQLKLYAAGILNNVGESIFAFLEHIGGVTLMALQGLAFTFKRPFRGNLFISQLEFIGVGSIFIIVLTGTFTGMVFALQGSYAFRLFNAEYLIGPSVLLSLTRELSPVMTGLMVTARAGSAIATEIGYMRENEQIDALSTMNINPIQYLVTPRIVAAIIMMPLLTALFTFCGTLGAYFVTVKMLGVTHSVFVTQTLRMVDLHDLYSGEIKAACFGLIIAAICCYFGYNSKGGARGVGLSTTKAVVASAVTLLIFDYFVTALMY
jgi:phospholipid/cholesterol/gamma-HCH transport system permease protein